MSINQAPSNGKLIAVAGVEVQKYLQTYPCLDGPDEIINRQCLAALRGNFHRRPEGDDAEMIALEPGRTLLDGAAAERLAKLYDSLGVAAPGREKLNEDFSWKVRLVPATARKILVIGSGDGHELLFLRAVAPQAQIFAIDWADKTIPHIAEITGAKVKAGNLLVELSGFDRDFDVCFSNHVLEHMYDPDKSIEVIFDRLRPGGVIISALPLDGSKSDAYAARLAAIADHAGVLRRVDLGYFDSGHPWKTDAADVARTLTRAGFKAVRLFHRPHHLTRNLGLSATELDRYRRQGLRLNGIVFGPLRTLIQMVFGDAPPRMLLKLLFAAERRVWFGSLRFKNDQSLEAAVVGQKA